MGVTETFFQWGFALTVQRGTVPAKDQAIFLNIANGVVGRFSPVQYTDTGQVIYCEVRTDIFDGESSDYKFFNTMTMIGDTNATTVSVQYSDDDYTTYNTARNIDMSVNRKQLRNLGRSRYRSFAFKHTGNTPLRLEAVDLEFVK